MINFIPLPPSPKKKKEKKSSSIQLPPLNGEGFVSGKDSSKTRTKQSDDEDEEGG
jgi:hypothetical protein